MLHSVDKPSSVYALDLKMFWAFLAYKVLRGGPTHVEDSTGFVVGDEGMINS